MVVKRVKESPINRMLHVEQEARPTDPPTHRQSERTIHGKYIYSFLRKVSQAEPPRSVNRLLLLLHEIESTVK